MLDLGGRHLGRGGPSGGRGWPREPGSPFHSPTVSRPPPPPRRAVARRAWPPPAPRPRPFWVCDQQRGRPRGLVATSLRELREQAGEALGLGPPARLVLAADGTAVESEAFFGALAPHTPLVALGPGQRWQPPTTGPYWEPEPPPGRGWPPEEEVAQVTVALAKASPRQLVGRLRVTAAVRGLRCDLGGLGPERLLRELLRLLAAMTRAVGQSLLTLSAALRRLLDGAPPQSVTYAR
ncbi:LOW QUALITY PROTEIN: cell death activator CIDE-B [Rissa tridactyla]|uniref:LOW QUALITY PROTEIN: cell death activator CIDE-B n=1 Tax=Rissa tridactyla TaxID=75485 RepID=UPI0023BABD41|nr:LOW QUALITY PROTEIN: cell death activator CIDE-B [Rissa tridactyla]